MDEFLDLPTLIVIGIAIVILFRLRSVLGTRTGNERPPIDRTRREAPARREATEETVVPLRPRPVETLDGDDERRARKVAAEIEQLGAAGPDVSAGLMAISESDPGFTPKSFLDGAKQAYEMIVTAFAEGDRRTLRNLLDKEVLEGFESAISEREAKEQHVDFTFVGLPKIDITGAELDKRNASITIRFRAEVVSATRDKDGNLIEGNADQVATIADEWTFARNPKSRDPNWKLVATSQIE